MAARPLPTGPNEVGRLPGSADADPVTALAPPSGVEPASGLEQSRSSHGAEFTAEQIERALSEHVATYRQMARESDDRVKQLIHDYTADAIERIAEGIVLSMRRVALIQSLATQIEAAKARGETA